MPGPVFIEGDRIELRTIEEEDIEFFTRARNHPEVRRHIHVFRTPRSVTREAKTFFENAEETDDKASFLVCADDERVGSVRLSLIVDTRRWANIAYWIAPDQQGKGYATEACELVIEYGFKELQLHRISGVAMTPNVASRRVLERLGFVHEGTKRERAFAEGEYVDEEQYGLLEDEWRERRED
jgi:RimJ/RimL family protein N-acetyltransferase